MATSTAPKSTDLMVISPEIITKLDENIVSVLGSKNIQGFEKAYRVADAVGKLQGLLTPAYMAPIMKLRGTGLGFRTDRDKSGTPYTEAEVKNCLIEAVLIGLQPVGNQFNIIAGNMYPTKPGFKYLLDCISGLEYTVVKELPRIKPDNSGAAVVCNIEWVYGGESKSKSIDFPIKMNAAMGADAVLGKADRKAYAWLFNKINGTEIPDGDVTDIDHKIVSTTVAKKTSEEAERERVLLLIADCKDGAALVKLRETLPAGFEAEVEERMSSFLD